MKRQRLIIAVAATAGLVSVAVIAALVIIERNSLEVTIHNNSGISLSGLIVVSGDGPETMVPDVGAGGSTSLQPILGDGENSLWLTDSQGNRYVLLSYFEGDPGGDLTITVTSASAEGLKGRVLDQTHYPSYGRTDESPLEVEAP